MCDQIKSMDVKARPITRIGSVTDKDLTEILDRISMLLEKE
jgi:mRNA-degrading endonuclease toxin of MazEF toxin-antitoxin module